MDTTKCKFDIAYLIAKEHLAFAKMAPLCDLLERHGVNIGTGHKNQKACATFIDFIALERQQAIVNSLASAKFFSLQLDGSTDVGNVEDEVFLAVFCDLHSADGRLHVHNEFLTIRRPSRSNAEGLLACLRLPGSC